VGAATDWATVSGGSFHTLALRADGELWVWGDNSYGQLGDDTGEWKSYPTRVGAATDWAVVEAGYYHSVAIRADGGLWAWGDNSYGQVGCGDSATELYAPVQVGEGFRVLAK
jgi:alpha-tubulin suppressor-like RCC1 family protein